MERRINLSKTKCLKLALFFQPGSDQPGLHVVMLDARYDRDPTFSFHGAVANYHRQHKCCCHQWIWMTRFIFIKTTIIRRVSRGVNSHVELHPVGLVEGGAGQGGRDHCHRVRSAGYLDDNGFLRTAPPPWSWVRHLCFPCGLGCYCTFIHWSEIVRCSSQQTWQRLKSSIVRTTHTPGVVTPSTRP